MKCRLSDQQIKLFKSFGKMPMANGFLDKKNFKRFGGKWVSHVK